MKKALSMLLVAAMALTMLAGCGSKAGAFDKEVVAVAGPIEDGAKLVYWPMWSETEPQGMVISKAIDAFTAKTGIEVEVNWAGGRDTRKTLSPALDVGETIDLFDEDIERVNNTWGKYVMDIDALYEASALKGAQSATLINLAKELGGGKMKCVPYQPSTFVTMYNKAAFDKAGIKAVPKTWDEFMAACESLKKAGFIPLTVDDAYMAAFFGYVMDRIVGADTTKAVAAGDFANAAVLETAKVIEELVKKGYMDPRAAGNAFPAGQSTVANGEVAMYLNGTWLPNEIKKETPADFKWGSFAFPGAIKDGGDGPEANQFGSQCFAVSKTSKYPNAAFALIEFLTSGEWDQTLATETLGVPMANDAKWPDALVEAKACLDSTTKRLSWAVDMENDANVNASIKENMAKMIGGKIDAQQFADAFAKTQKAA
ncbi:MAG: extracellular solute-binding protein [Oscillospiraceae bacterium]